MHAVLGANGRAGGETARALIELGEPVRVVLRSPGQDEKWTALGAEVAFASIENIDVMTDALEGASTAFLLNPPPVGGNPYSQTEVLGTALADAVRRARLPKIVVLSSIGAQHPFDTGVIATLNRMEALLDGVAQTTAFLRSGYFIESWSEVVDVVISERVLPTFLDPAQKIPMVSTIDVGRTAASLLCDDWSGKRIVELTGPEDYSAGDVASAFAKALGRTVTPMLVPPDRRVAMLVEEGLPREVVDALLSMYEAIAGGLFVRQDGNEHRCGTISLTTAIELVIAACGQLKPG